MHKRTLEERYNVYFEPWRQWVGPGEVILSWHPEAFNAAARSLRAAREMATEIVAVEKRYEEANAGNRSYWRLGRYISVMGLDDSWQLDSFLPAIENVNRWLQRWGCRTLSYCID